MGRFERKIERFIVRGIFKSITWILLAPFKLLVWLFSGFKAAKYINSHGYIVLNEFNELEHRYMAIKLLGRELASNEVVHHINGNKTDNQARNLCLMDREKHELFHSWLRWKKEKSGKYPSFRDQNRILVEEYGGTLLSSLKPLAQEKLLDRNEVVENDKKDRADSEIFVVRRNKVTKKMFVEFDEEILISPDGKEVELDPERFGEPEEVPESELTENQITTCHNKTKGRAAASSESRKRAQLQKRLFDELRKERKRIADEKGVPVYIVFDNKTLEEIAEIMPVSESLMLQIKGVGPVKFRMYGILFINVVKKFKNAG